MKNKNHELDIVLNQCKKGTITQKEAVNHIGSFVIRNYPVFGLQKFDEDFRQDVILWLLEHGEYLVQNYDPEIGDFFTFLFCYVKTLINTKKRRLAVNSLCEKVINEEMKKLVDDKAQKYNKINYSYIDMPKAPYSYKPIPADVLKQTLHEMAAESPDKKLLVLALKSSYYLDDTQIEKIASICKINKDYFYETVQLCKDSIQRRIERREKFLDRRNAAYYHHRRYKKLIEQLNQTDIQNKDLLAKINNKAIRFSKRWDKMNNMFEDGLLKLRPTSKTVAELLGICERQVNYYIKCAKKEYGIKY